MGGDLPPMSQLVKNFGDIIYKGLSTSLRKVLIKTEFKNWLARDVPELKDLSTYPAVFSGILLIRVSVT